MKNFFKVTASELRRDPVARPMCAECGTRYAVSEGYCDQCAWLVGVHLGDDVHEHVLELDEPDEPEPVVLTAPTPEEILSVLTDHPCPHCGDLDCSQDVCRSCNTCSRKCSCTAEQRARARAPKLDYPPLPEGAGIPEDFPRGHPLSKAKPLVVWNFDE